MGSISDQLTPMGHEMRKHFMFDPKYMPFNHGSFGTYPTSVSTLRLQYQAMAESRPDTFLRWTYRPLLLAARTAISTYLNAPLDTCVFTQNATMSVNVVLRNLVFAPGDVIVYFDTIYGACEKTLAYVMETTPVEAVKVEYLYPITDEELVGLFREKVSEMKGKGKNVRLAVFDTVVSLPGVRMPFERLTEACREEGVMSCIDGAHGVGHIPLDMKALDPDFFVSNCHKWLFTPRGCSVLYVPERNQHLIRSSLPTSHGFVPSAKMAAKLHINNPLPPSDSSPFVELFDFVATLDISPYLVTPAAIEFRALTCGGEQNIYSYIRSVIHTGGNTVAKILGTSVMDLPSATPEAPSTLRACAFANVKLPLIISPQGTSPKTGEIPHSDIRTVTNWLQATLAEKYDTFVAVILYRGSWWVRLSGMIYLEAGDFEWAGNVLKGLCGEIKAGRYGEKVEVQIQNITEKVAKL